MNARGCLLACFCALVVLAGASSQNVRRLLQSHNAVNADLAINTLQSAAATSDAINRAVALGARPDVVRRAGQLGTTLTWAVSQTNNDRQQTAERMADWDSAGSGAKRK